jgi:hypothetical protein
MNFKGLKLPRKKKFEFLLSLTVWPIFRDLNQHLGLIFFKHGLCYVFHATD